MKIRDGDWSLFSSDIQRGRYTWVRHNADGTMTFRTDYHVQPTIDANQAARNMARPGWKGDYHRIASVPLNTFFDELKEPLQQDDQKFVSKWLNDSDRRAWRTKEGRV